MSKILHTYLWQLTFSGKGGSYGNLYIVSTKNIQSSVIGFCSKQVIIFIDSQHNIGRLQINESNKCYSNTIFLSFVLPLQEQHVPHVWAEENTILKGKVVTDCLLSMELHLFANFVCMSHCNLFISFHMLNLTFLL